MKSLCCLWLMTASLAFGVEVGNTQAQVIAEKGNPPSQLAAGSRRVLQYPDMNVVLKDGRVSSIRPSAGAADSPPTPGTPSAAEGSKEEFDAAVARVKAIINQPPPFQAYEPGIPVNMYRPGWFHDGATKPDFNTVDVRTTQQLPYAEHPFVSSDVCADLIFPGAQLEFNPMLKYFYTDRTLPKKRLTASEMIEINRLYRIIGRDETLLGLQAH